MLGIKKNQKIPALGFFRIEMDLKVVFPEDLELNRENIKEFVKDYLEKPISFVLEKYSSMREKIKL